MMKGKKIAIVQSNYIPWRGYFDLIQRVDEFIFYDDIQYTKRDWRNRNIIKTPQGSQWITIPVQTKGKFSQLICETVVTDQEWRQSHWKALQANYGRSPFFKEVQSFLQPLYVESNETNLSKINFLFVDAICRYLGIKTKISWSMDYMRKEGKTENLINLCQQANADEYISGPKAKDYIDASTFKDAGIRLTWIDYSGYAEYSQPYPPFDPFVTVLDLLFSQGKNSTLYLTPREETFA